MAIIILLIITNLLNSVHVSWSCPSEERERETTNKALCFSSGDSGGGGKGDMDEWEYW